MILDVTGDLITNERQRKQLVLDDRTVGLLGKFSIMAAWARETQTGVIGLLIMGRGFESLRAHQ